MRARTEEAYSFFAHRDIWYCHDPCGLVRHGDHQCKGMGGELPEKEAGFEGDTTEYTMCLSNLLSNVQFTHDSS